MNDDLIIICHDDKAQTWDTIDIQYVKQNYDYFDCIIDHCDYDRYEDKDIATLSEKINTEWDTIKQIVLEIYNTDFEEYTKKMKGFFLIIEPYTKR